MDSVVNRALLYRVTGGHRASVSLKDRQLAPVRRDHEIVMIRATGVARRKTLVLDRERSHAVRPDGVRPRSVFRPELAGSIKGSFPDKGGAASTVECPQPAFDDVRGNRWIARTSVYELVPDLEAVTPDKTPVSTSPRRVSRLVMAYKARGKQTKHETRNED
jgi:hypothetical protein